MCLPGKYPLSVVASHCLPWPSFHEVWLSEFSFMQIRAESNHSQCSTCLRHRHLIKSLGHHLLARRQQQMFYWQHLKDQYADRLEYYRLRSMSRMQDGQSILIIQDGMDQSKACIPRSKWMKSKEFSRFVRPRLHVSLTLVHGYFCLWSISDPDCMKDSNASTETLCHAMHLLERDFDASREVKNNMLLRWAAAQVSSSNVRSITFRFLRQGHSHEDVDQAFGRLSRHLSSKLQRANVPQDFVDSVDGFAKAMYRPHEAGRYTVKLDRCRDWMLFLIHIICICPFSHSLISYHYQCKKDRDGFSSLASLFFFTRRDPKANMMTEEELPSWRCAIPHHWCGGTGSSTRVLLSEAVWWGACRCPYWKPSLGLLCSSWRCDFKDWSCRIILRSANHIV